MLAIGPGDGADEPAEVEALVQPSPGMFGQLGAAGFGAFAQDVVAVFGPRTGRWRSGKVRPRVQLVSTHSS